MADDHQSDGFLFELSSVLVFAGSHIVRIPDDQLYGFRMINYIS